MNPMVIMSMVRLRFTRLLRDRSGLVWLIVMPMVFSFLMGNLLGDWSDQTTNLPRLVVYARDAGPSAEALLTALDGNDKFRLVRADSIVDQESARLAVEDGRITAALFIPARFSAAAAAGRSSELKLYYDSDRLSSQTVRTLLEKSALKVNAMASARSLVATGAAAAAVPVDSALAFDESRFDRLWNEPRVTLEAVTLGRVAEGGLNLTSSSQHVGPAYILFFVLMFMMVSAKDIVQEREQRTLARLMVSRASSLDLVLGFFAGGMAIGLVQSTILLVLNSLAFGLDYGDSPVGLILVIVLFAAISSAASILLGSLARSGAQADGLGTALTMVLAALGGLWWPLEIVPEFMQVIGRVLPTGQAITIFHDMIGRGHVLADILPLLGGLALWFVVLMILAIAGLRRLIAV